MAEVTGFVLRLGNADVGSGVNRSGLAVGSAVLAEVAAGAKVGEGVACWTTLMSIGGVLAAYVIPAPPKHTSKSMKIERARERGIRRPLREWLKWSPEPIHGHRWRTRHDPEVTAAGPTG